MHPSGMVLTTALSSSTIFVPISRPYAPKSRLNPKHFVSVLTCVFAGKPDFHDSLLKRLFKSRHDFIDRITSEISTRMLCFAKIKVCFCSLTTSSIIRSDWRTYQYVQEFKQPVLIEIISISAFLLTFGSPRSAPPIRFPALFFGPRSFTVFPLSVSSTTTKGVVMTS